MRPVTPGTVLWLVSNHPRHLIKPLPCAWRAALRPCGLGLRASDGKEALLTKAPALGQSDPLLASC